MSRLDYSHLKHSNEQPVKGYSRKESFYLQKGNGKVRRYSEEYKGDVSVFEATRGKFIEYLVEKASKSNQDDNRILSNVEKNYDETENSDVSR